MKGYGFMKKRILSLFVIITILFQTAGISVSAVSANVNPIEQMLRAALCNQDEFLKKIDEFTAGDNLSVYADGAEISVGERPSLNSIGADVSNEPVAIMHDDTLHVSVDEMAPVLGYEVDLDNNGTNYIEFDGEKIEISTTKSDLNSDKISGVMIDGEVYAPATDIADISNHQLAVEEQSGKAKFLDKFQTKRLFIKIKDINTLYSESVLTAFSDVSQITISSEGIIFAVFETEKATETAYNLLKNNSLIEYAEPDNLVAISFDSYYTWGREYCNLDNFIDAYPSFIESGNEVTVAVIDSGLNAEDPIFEGRVIYDETMPSAKDTYGHGTHVSGIIAAFTKDCGAEIKICPYKLEIEDDGAISYASLSELYITVSKASKHDIINMSFGISPVLFYQTLIHAIDQGTNSLFVISAGNESSAVPEDSLAGYISKKSNGIVATAISSNGIPAYFSNYTTGDNSSYIAAPGVDVCSTYYINGEKYCYMSGTSQAAPHVAAACAMIAHVTKGSFTPQALKNTIFSRYCKTPETWYSNYGKGILYFNIETSGSFGSGFTWNYADGNLSIAGSGEMSEFSNPDFIPWKHLSKKITSLSLNGPITGFDMEKLGLLPSLKSITVSDDNTEFTTINGALYTKDGKTLVRYPQGGDCVEFIVSESVTTIGEDAFSGCKELCSIVITPSITKIESGAFEGCTNMSDIYFTGTLQQWNSVEKGEGWDASTGTATYNKTYSVTTEYVLPHYSGKCGETAIWKLWTDKGLLCIEGKGAMYDFELTTANGAITGSTAGWSPYKSYVKKLEIKNGITVIGKYAFNSSVSFTEAVLGNTVTTIRDNAFDYTLKKLTLSDSFEGFDGSALSGCLNLSNIYVSENSERYKSVDGIVYTKDGKELIAYPPAKMDEEYNMPDGVKKIANDVFNGNRYVKKVNFCEGLEEIGDRAFMSSAIYYDISFPSSLKKLGVSALEGCTSIMTTALPEGFEHLGDRAFAKCSILRYITIPSSIKTIGSQVITQCTGMNCIYFDGTKEEWDAVNKESDWNHLQKNVEVIYETRMPATEHDTSGSCGQNAKWYYWADDQLLCIKGSGAMTVSSALKEYKDNIKTVYIEEGITEIPNTFFYAYSILADIKLPATIKTIGQSAFGDCPMLVSIVIPKGVTELKYGTFSGCTSLKNVVLPETLQGMESYGFAGCSSLEAIDIPDSVIFVGVGSFSGCTALKSVNIPANTSEIYGTTFEGCKVLEEVKMHENITAIGQGAFRGCASLKEITIPQGVTIIEKTTFKDCTALETVNWSDNITFIDDYAFENCTSLKPLTLPKNLENISNLSFKNSSVTSFAVHPESTKLAQRDGVVYSYDLSELIAYPVSAAAAEYTVISGVKKINSKAFQYVDKLERIILPDTLTEICDRAFYNSTSLSNLDAHCLEIIGNEAFYGCTAFTGIGVQNKLKEIGEYAFYRCVAISEVTIGENVEYIGKQAYSGCSDISEILIYARERTIGDYVFSSTLSKLSCVLHTGTSEQWPSSRYGLSSVVKVVHNYNPETKKASGSCGENAIWTLDPFNGTLEISGSGDTYDYESRNQLPWYACYDLINVVTIKDSVSSVGNNMFSSHQQIKEIHMSDSVKRIGSKAFASCKGLTELSLGAGVQIIDSSAFEYCNALTQISIPESVKTIGNNAFYYCSALKSISLPSSLETIGSNVFYNCSALKTAQLSFETNGIPENMFFNCTTLTDVILTNGIKSIGKSAFENCSKLVNINLPASIEAIGERAFYGCTTMPLTQLPDEVKTVGKEAFYNCKAIKTLVINSKVESFGGSCFYYAGASYNIYYKGSISEWKAISNVSTVSSRASVCYYFDGVNYPDYFGTIGSSEYWSLDKETGILLIEGSNTMSSSLVSAYTKYKSYVKTIVFKGNITSIPSNAFKSMYNLESVTIPKQVKTIGTSAFEGCNTLVRIDMSESAITSIPNYCFNGCSSLSEIILPQGLSSIGNYAFKSCGKLKSITFPSGLKTIGTYAFESCIALEAVDIPEGVTQIGEYAFRYDRSVSTVNLPSSLTTLGKNAFYDCNKLTTVTIPSGVKSIEASTFYYCNALESVYIHADIESINKSAFGIGDGACSKATIYYAGTREKWNTVTGGETLPVLDIKFNYGSTPSGTQGSCGNSVFWNFDTDSGVLTLSGSGTMTDWNAEDPELIPWYEYSNEISEVVIASDITYIGKNAFSTCTAIEKITIEEGNTSYYSDNGIIYKKSPHELVYYPLFNTAKSYTVPEGVKNIAPGVFKGNTSLEEVFLPDGLTVVEDSVFADCASLARVFIPKTVASIKSHAFDNCPNLTKIHYEGSVSEWDKAEKADDWSDTQKSVYYYVDRTNIFDDYGIVNSGGMVWHYYDSTKTLKIFTEGDLPDLSDSPPAYPWSRIKTTVEFAEIIGPTTRIGKNCFYNLSKLREVTLPETVTLIGNYAFSGCKSLTHINIPKDVTAIGVRAFRECSSLESIDIPDSVKTLGESVFYDCESLKTIKLGSGISTIPSYAFQDCISITEFTVPANVTAISGGAFSGCTGLKTFIIPKTVKSLGNNFVPSSLETLTIYYEDTQSKFKSLYSLNSTHKFKVVYNYNADPDIVSGTCGTQVEWILNKKTGVLEISGRGAIPGYSSVAPWQEHSSSIKSVVISDNITALGMNAFSNCTSIEEITIPETVKMIYSNAFKNCIKLSKITYAGPKVNWNAIYKEPGWDLSMSTDVSGGARIVCLKSDDEYTENGINVDESDIKEMYIIITPQGILNVDTMSMNWDYSGYIIVAFYNDDGLIDVKTSFALSNNMRYQIPQNATRVKVMWVKGLKSLRPLCCAVEEKL